MRRLVFATLLVALGKSSPATAVDLSGDYVVTVPTSCSITVVQTGTAFKTTGFCDFNGTSTPFSASGTVDPVTGAFSGTSDLGGVCTGVISGTGDGEVITATGTAPCYSGPITATKCGNGVIDPLENCEDGNQADGDCCSARCRLDPAGTACTSDGNECTDDVCNATGTCAHVPNAGPCDDGNGCNIGDHCAGGVCVLGSPAPAGQACKDDLDPCTADVCNATGACTHVPVSPAECHRAVACHSTCTEKLKECRQACPGSGQARRECRASCVQQSTCTAPGARIRTLAYVVTECTDDPQGRSSLKQALLIRRGNCDPVPVMDLGPSSPVFDLGLCRTIGADRAGYDFVAGGSLPTVGVFQAMAVLPDGSGVVFDVTRQFSGLPALTPELPEEGIFFVRADGSGLRWLGPPSRVHSILGQFRWAASPDGRTIAFIDLGPSRAGYEAPQVFLLDVRSGARRQLTHQPRVQMLQVSDPGIWFPTFLYRRTIGFYSGSTQVGTLTAFQVETNGGLEKELPPIVAQSGAHIVSQFGVTGVRPHEVLGLYPDRPAENGGFVREVFLVDRKEVLQLTAFNRRDTGPGGEGGRGLVIGDRALFVASANPFGENPHEVCQLFSISTRGDQLRQLTHLPWDGRPSPYGCAGVQPGCGISILTPAADQVTGTVLFSASCDPVGANPFGEQIFAMRPDGTGLRQLTNARGMTTDPDGTVHVELPTPFAYPPQKR